MLRWIICKHRDSKLRFSELLPVSVAFKTSHTALEADCPDNSGIKQEVLFTKSTLESHSLIRGDEPNDVFLSFFIFWMTLLLGITIEGSAVGHGRS